MVSFDRVNELLSYDPETGKFPWKISRPGCRAGSLAGSLSKSTGYIQIRIDGDLYYAHRVAHLLMNGHWPERNPEHNNDDKSDNCWGNIRDLAIKSENEGKKALRIDSTSGLKGVCWHRKAKKWMAHITLGGRLIYLGLFDDSRLAGLNYDAAAKIVFGRRFSKLNFLWEDSDHIVLSEKVLTQLEGI